MSYGDARAGRTEARTCTHDAPTGEALARRQRCRGDLRSWLLEFNPLAYPLPFSPDHDKVIAKLQDALMDKGLFAEAMPRGSGKTTIAVDAAAWAMLEGWQPYIVLIGADNDAAIDMLDGIKSLIEYSDEVAESYPEVAAYVRHAQGQAAKANFQIQENGDSSGLIWARDEIVFPQVPDSACAGAIAECRGMTGKIRGMRHAVRSGEVIRPSFAIVDDPQTRESAASPAQCDKRMKTLRGDILGLGGPGNKISAVVTCTIIEQGDMASQLLDHDKSPEFQGETFKLVYEWSKSPRLWEKYTEIRRDEFTRDKASRMLDGDLRVKHWESNLYYTENREAMDEGSRVAWPERKEADEISAIQNAYNVLCDMGEEAFYAEYMNDPITLHNSPYELTRSMVMARVNGLPRMHAPEHTADSTAMIDINYAGMHWTACAWANDLTGYIMDYGKYPSGRAHLVPNPKKLTETEVENLIYNGLTVLTKELALRPWMRGGKAHRLSVLMIDCGRWTSLVMRWINQNTTPGVRIIASRGFGHAKYRQVTPIEMGDNWHRSKFKAGGQAISHNADYWRGRGQKSFLKEPGAPGSISIFGKKPEEHKNFAGHIVAEKLTEYVEATPEHGEFYRWTREPGSLNDLLDSLVGSLVAASACGLGTQTQRRRARPKRKMARVNL